MPHTFAMLARLCEVYAHLEVSATFSVQLCDKPTTLRHALATTVQDYRKVLGISCSLNRSFDERLRQLRVRAGTSHIVRLYNYGFEIMAA